MLGRPQQATDLMVDADLLPAPGMINFGFHISAYRTSHYSATRWTNQLLPRLFTLEVLEREQNATCRHEAQLLRVLVGDLMAARMQTAMIRAQLTDSTDVPYWGTDIFEPPQREVMICPVDAPFKASPTILAGPLDALFVSVPGRHLAGR